MAKAAFNKKKTLFTSKLDLELRKKLVECYIRSIALYGAETWTLRKLDSELLRRIFVIIKEYVTERRTKLHN
jgi:hypothetical protein